jgi:hypothetical protein
MRFLIIVFALVFGFLSFAPNMQGGQFFKFNEVLQHFEDHQESKESFNSFFSFLKNHYFSNHGTKENEKHLPFKTNILNTFVLVIHEVKLVPVNEDPIEIIEKSSCFGEPNGQVSKTSISIWNPPQMA